MNKILVTGGSGFIGSNLISSLIENSENIVLNIDINEPKIETQKSNWSYLDIQNKAELKAVLKQFMPNEVIHLAARTDLRGTSIQDYSTNTIGTQNLVEVLNEINFEGRAIFTSSMYVCEPGYSPKDFEDYNPHTIYGESKVKSEEIVKSINKKYSWVITRPTSIWGPWFGEPYADFFNIVLSKKYFHLGNKSCNKTYGYVENTTAQILALLKADFEIVNGKVFYLGDLPAYNIAEWADEIAATVPYSIMKIPFAIFRALAIFGDFCKYFGIKFPMTSFRLKNMTTNNIHDLNPIIGIVNELPFSRRQGTIKTVNWIKNKKAI
jgi:nucleoside-diphosphate-sugar epimerase